MDKVQLEIKPIKTGKVERRTPGGQIYEVITHLTFDERLATALDIANRCVVIDQETGRAYPSVYEDLHMTLGIIRAYTNIEVPQEDPEEFYDYVQHAGIVEEIEMGVEAWEMWNIRSNVDRLIETTVKLEDAKNSMDVFFKQLADGTAMGEDMIRSINEGMEALAPVAGQIQPRVDDNILRFGKKKK